jgi:hypothetical protein
MVGLNIRYPSFSPARGSFNFFEQIVEEPSMTPGRAR